MKIGDGEIGRGVALVIWLVIGLVIALIVIGRPGKVHDRGVAGGQIKRSPMIYANPDYYDYIRRIELGSNGNAKLTAGAGQVVHFAAQGMYTIDLIKGRLDIFDLRQVTPYGTNEIRRLPNCTNRFRIETGVFAMRQETLFRPRTPDEAPVIVFPERYVFEADPLVFAGENSKSNLYYMTESRDLGVSERIYYRNNLLERITIADAKRRGLILLSKAEQIQTSGTPFDNPAPK